MGGPEWFTTALQITGYIVWVIAGGVIGGLAGANIARFFCERFLWKDR